MEAELNWSTLASATSAVMASRQQMTATPRIDRIHPITRVRTGDVFECPDHSHAAIIQSGALMVELMMSNGSVLPLARYSAGDLVPTLHRLATPAFSLGYRAERMTQLSWLRKDAAGAAIGDRVARASETLLFAALRQITSLACLPVAYRLYVEILRHAMGPTAAEPLTHGELASRVCTSRETISREISILKREGVLSQARAIELLAPDDLTKRIARALNLDNDAEVGECIGMPSIEA